MEIDWQQRVRDVREALAREDLSDFKSIGDLLDDQWVSAAKCLPPFVSCELIKFSGVVEGLEYKSAQVLAQLSDPELIEEYGVFNVLRYMRSVHSSDSWITQGAPEDQPEDLQHDADTVFLDGWEASFEAGNGISIGFKVETWMPLPI